MKDGTDSIPKVTVEELVKEVAKIYGLLIRKGLPFSRIPPVMLWGPPGTGKSQAVRQIAAEIEKSTGKMVKITDIRLLLFDPVGLRGIPAANKDRTRAVWLKPEIFDMDPSEEIINILLLDEISAAPPAVQAAAYQITLDRAIGEHRLPDNCIVMAAGNRMTDRAVSYKMPSPLANRLQHYEISVDFESWKEWAIGNSIHPDVLGFLAFDNAKLCPEEVPPDRLSFPSPRMWEKVSRLIELLEEQASPEELYGPVSACVGTDTALAFLRWRIDHRDLPVVEDIFRGRSTALPATPDGLYALIGSMVRYVKDHSSGARGMVSKAELDNMSVYASRFSEDYRACLYHSLEKLPGVEKTLRKVKLYMEHQKRSGGYMNG